MEVESRLQITDIERFEHLIVHQQSKKQFKKFNTNDLFKKDI